LYCHICRRRTAHVEGRREVVAVREDVAQIVVAEIIADLTDRRGLRQEWEQIDPGTRQEIVATWEGIVRRHLYGAPGGER